MELKPNTKKLIGEINYKTIEVNEIQKLIVHIMSNKFHSHEISLFNDEKIILRDVVQSNNDGENIYLDDDILFLKLAKKELVEIKFYKAQLDINTIEGLNLFKFMRKYFIEGSNYSDNETGKSKYDIKKILDYEYEDFIQHIILNIFPGDKIPEFVDEINFENRVIMEVSIPNLKLFFEGINKIYPKQTTVKHLKNKLISEYNTEKKYIEFRIGDYFRYYASIYEMLKYLQLDGILEINDVILYYKESKVKKNISYLYIKFELEKIVQNLTPLFLEGFKIKQSNQYLSEFNNGILNIDNKLFAEYSGEKILNIVKILFNYRDYSGKSEFKYKELVKYFEKNIDEYNYFYEKVNVNNQYENTKKLKSDEIEDLLLIKIFNKEYFKGSLGHENRKKKIFIYKTKTTGLLI